MITAQIIRAKILPSINWSFTIDGLKIMRSAQKSAKGTSGKIEIYAAMQDRYKIFTGNGSIDVFNPFTLEKSNFLADILPAVYSDAIDRFWFQDRPENAKYVTATLDILKELDSRLRAYIEQNSAPAIPIPPTEPTPPGTFFPTPGTPAPAPSPGTPAPIIKASQKNIIIGLASLFLISKFI